MRRLTLEETKSIEFSILDYFASICEEYNLKYFLAYGTLIGAIRHKGFIPWDDDIDIVMPRTDYNKFIEISTNTSNGQYTTCVPNVNGYCYEYAKVIDSATFVKEEADLKECQNGVWIDIFPMDGLNPDDKLHHQLLLIGQRMRVASIYQSFPHKMGKVLAPFEWLFWKTCRAIGYGAILSKTIKWSQKYKYEDCDIVGYASSVPAHNKYLKKEWFEESVMVEFEGKHFRAPKKYHEYLTTQYGDYMKLPPVEQQVGHPMEAYRIEKNENI